MLTDGSLMAGAVLPALAQTGIPVGRVALLGQLVHQVVTTERWIAQDEGGRAAPGATPDFNCRDWGR